jgi:putative transposase
MITDKLASYGAAKKGGNARHRASPAQGTEQPSREFALTRRRERQMKQLKSAGQAQRFLSAHDQINNLFHLRRDHVTSAEHSARRSQTFQVWAEISSMGWH